MMKNSHVDSSLDLLLDIDGTLESITQTAKQRVEMLKKGSAQEFFTRGREIAKASDLGHRIPDGTIISFEDPDDLMLYLRQNDQA